MSASAPHEPAKLGLVRRAAHEHVHDRRAPVALRKVAERILRRSAARRRGRARAALVGIAAAAGTRNVRILADVVVRLQALPSEQRRLASGACGREQLDCGREAEEGRIVTRRDSEEEAERDRLLETALAALGDRA